MPSLHLIALSAGLIALSAGLAAIQGMDLCDTQVLMLSGTGKDDPVSWDFRCSAGRGAGRWSVIAVPSSWECQGFGTFGYQSDAKPAEQGIYRRTITVPAAWSGRRVQLVFDGVQTDTTVLIDDQPAGPMHIGGFYRFAYDITALAKPGMACRLEVRVDKRSSDESVNQAERAGDYWNFSGIIRPVSLASTPQQHLERLAIDAQGDGHITVDAYAAGLKGDERIEAEVERLDGTSVAAITAMPAVASGATRLAGAIPAVRPWSAESPSLYQLEVRLMQGQAVVHRLRQRFGFRTIELRLGDGLYVNGRRVVLKGCCRHTFWPDSGRTTSAAVSALDIGLIKDMNMNAVRMSHYPPEQSFLDACDEQGLYVLDELAGWHHCYASPIGHQLVGEMVTRDVNHPSIIMWDNGNEGGWNKELDDDFAQWDPSHRQVVHPWANFRGLNTKHYPDYKGIVALAAGPDVFMPTEFQHGLFDGGAGAGLWDAWEVMRASPRLGGGFIWAFLDEGVKRVDLDGRIDVAGNRAPDGIVGPYREKEGSFFTIKAVWSPVIIPLAALPHGFTGMLPVENRYDQTDLSTCRFTWQLWHLHTPGDHVPGHTVIASGTVPGPACPAGAKATLALALPAALAQADVLGLTVQDANGREVLAWSWPLRDDLVPALPAPVAGQPGAHASEDAAAITLAAAGTTLTISKASGMLGDVRHGGRLVGLSNGPRAVTGPSVLTTISVHADGGDQVVEAVFTGDLRLVRWRLRGDGWLHLDYTYQASGPHDLLGVGFDLVEAGVTAKRWLGMGPYRVWKNRLLGGTLDVWGNDYNDSMTGHSLWQYPEFKGYFAAVRWLDLATTAGTISLRLPGGERFVQVLTPRWPEDSMHALTVFPTTTLSLLDAIPPIGNKFHRIENGGPQAAKTIAVGDYQGACDLRFGDVGE